MSVHTTPADALESQAMAIRDSGYEGWVAWLDDGGPLWTPVFQAVKHSRVLPLAHGMRDLDDRPVTRTTMEWPQVPQRQIQRLEVYGLHASFPNDQPIVRLDREPGADLRFVVLNMGGTVVHANTDGTVSRGQERLGFVGWKVGVWDVRGDWCQMWDVTRTGVVDLGRREGSITATPPSGYGISPHIFGG